jgi:hypothetical protein
MSGSGVGESPPEEGLNGGNVSAAVIRIGDTVRRPAGPWSPAVDALLRHLEACGFEHAPRPLGYDSSGRQVVSYIAGETAADPGDLDGPALREIGGIIRRLHDLCSSFVPPADAWWNTAIPPDKEELICHNDLAPWNLARGAGRLVFVDWDGAGPSSRLWDLAYAVHGFVPLSCRAPLPEDQVVDRMRALLSGYRLDDDRVGDLLELLARRIYSMYVLLGSGHVTGAQPWARLWDEGHGASWLADARYAEEHVERWRLALVSR